MAQARAQSVLANKTVVIEGNIGVGKSTCLDLCRRTLRIRAYTEPVEEWRQFAGEHNLLDLLYTNPKRWAFLFQTRVQRSCADVVAKAEGDFPRLFERSSYSAHYCFADVMYKQGYLCDVEKASLDDSFVTDRESHRLLQVDRIVYLRSAPEVALERVVARNRAEETGIDLGYLTQLHAAHDDWLLHGMYPQPAPVTVVNANGSLGEVREACCAAVCTALKET